jgi:hypothetical protein
LTAIKTTRTITRCAKELKDYYKSLRGPNPQDEVSFQKDISATIVKESENAYARQSRKKRSWKCYLRISGLFPARRR